MASVNLSNVWPYNAIKEVTVDGQKMVRIPRIYVRSANLEEGPYKGKVAYHISPWDLYGFHVHPAFMNKGVAAKALDLSCFEASKDSSGKPASVSTTAFWQQINRADAIAACNKRNIAGGSADQTGWHCWDIYCQHLLARLMLIELGTTNIPTKEDGTDYVYRGIHFPAGNSSNPTWLPGLGNIGDKIYLYDNSGNFQMVNTGVKAPANGWPTSFSVNKGGNFDLGDVFVASATTTTEASGICGDYQRIARSNVSETGFMTGYRGTGTVDPAHSHGMFGITQTTNWTTPGCGEPTNVYASLDMNDGLKNDLNGPLRFRLAHFVM